MDDLVKLLEVRNVWHGPAD